MPVALIVNGKQVVEAVSGKVSCGSVKSEGAIRRIYKGQRFILVELSVPLIQDYFVSDGGP